MGLGASGDPASRNIGTRLAFSDGESGRSFPVLHGTLTTLGISGAQPRPLERFVYPATKSYGGESGMRPSKYISSHPTQNFVLDVSDIEGCRPHASGWYHRAPRGTNPLDPHYKLPAAPEPPPPVVPKFLRDTLDVSDISTKAQKREARPRAHGGALDTSDIPGSKAGWKPAARQRPQAGAPHAAGLDISDITQRGGAAQQQFQQAQQQPQSQPRTPGRSEGGGEPRGHARTPSGSADGVGVIQGVEWRTRRFGAQRKAGEARAAARAAADAMLLAAPAASPLVSTRGLSALLTAFRLVDRERVGKVAAKEFAAVLGQSGLGLSKEEVGRLVEGMGGTAGLVEYRPFLGKLYARLQQHQPPPPLQQQAQQQGQSQLQQRRLRPSRQVGEPQASPAELCLPQWHQARQRRLQTIVALELGQQPACNAVEAEVTGLGPPRTRLVRPFGKRMEGQGLCASQQRTPSQHWFGRFDGASREKLTSAPPTFGRRASILPVAAGGLPRPGQACRPGTVAGSQARPARAAQLPACPARQSQTAPAEGCTRPLLAWSWEGQTLTRSPPRPLQWRGT